MEVAMRALILVLAVSWSGLAPADAATGMEYDARCTVRIEGKTYLHHRKCKIDFWANAAGPLTCGEAANGVNACVKCDNKDGTCKASWGDGVFPKALRSLGLVKRIGKTDCWTGKRTHICFREWKDPETSYLPRKAERDINVHCFIQVDGKTHLDRKCIVHYEREVGGQENSYYVQIGNKEPRGGHFVYLQKPGTTTSGPTSGWSADWNNGESHAHNNLGELKLVKDCWINDRAKICVGDIKPIAIR
jgi:hypothetical protein